MTEEMTNDEVRKFLSDSGENESERAYFDWAVDVDNLPYPSGEVFYASELVRFIRKLAEARMKAETERRHNDDAESKLFTHYDRRLFRHINDIMGCACFPDLLERKLFPNAKEITESNAVYNAVRWHLPRFSLSDPGNTVVAVGDGHTPRTAALFAFRTAWNAYSVDPLLRIKDWKTARLHTYPVKIEEEGFHFTSPVVIVAVHSHASLKATLEHIQSPNRALVAMPCCKPIDLDVPPDMRYNDSGIWSEKNEILIWKQI